MTEFTPTPWSIFRRLNEVWSRDTRVAIVDREKDAHLIAAAPDMYEALEKISRWTLTDTEAHKVAIAALSKARGET